MDEKNMKISATILSIRRDAEIRKSNLSASDTIWLCNEALAALDDLEKLEKDQKQKEFYSDNWDKPSMFGPNT